MKQQTVVEAALVFVSFKVIKIDISFQELREYVFLHVGG